jgi:hypothetical protein
MSHAIKLTKVERRQLEAVEAELKPWGLAYTLQRTHHLIVIVEGPKGGRWRVIIACTPRDADTAVTYARSNARSVIRNINERLGL